MKSLLFPTDFSEAAENAFIYALEFASHYGSDINTVNVYQQPRIPGLERFPTTAEEIYESMRMEAFEEYKEATGKLRGIAEAKGKQHLLKTHDFKVGGIVDTIIREAKETNASMVVMGTKGATGLQEIFLGSKTAGLMASAPCPVLAVPGEATFDGEIDNVMIAVDLKGEDEALIKKVLEVTSSMKSNLLVVHIDTVLNPTEGHEDKLNALKQKFASESRVSFQQRNNLDVEGAILDFAEREKVDVMVTVSKQRGFFQQLFHYSISRRLAYHSRIPILSIPEGLL